MSAAAKPPRGAPRTRVKSRWRPLAWSVAVASALSGAGGGAWWVVEGGLVAQAGQTAVAAFARTSATLGLAIQDVLVTGRRETAPEAILGALGIERGSPLATFNPHGARQRLEALPWVRAAAIERRFPDTVVVHLQERTPIAIWQHEGRYALVDPEGTVIPDGRVERFGDLIVVVGEDAPRHAAKLLALLTSEPHLMTRIAAAVRVGGRRWNLTVDNGVEVRLPDHDAAAAWALLARHERDHGILDRDVRILDLRLSDRLIVTPAEGVNATRPPNGRAT